MLSFRLSFNKGNLDLKTLWAYSFTVQRKWPISHWECFSFFHFAVSQALCPHLPPHLLEKSNPGWSAACFGSPSSRVSYCLKLCTSFYRASEFPPVGWWWLPRVPSHSACSCHLSRAPSCHLSCVAHWICFVARKTCSCSGLSTLQGILSWPLTWFWLQGEAGESKVFKRSDVTFVLGPNLTTKQKLFKHWGKGGRKTLLLEAARKESSRVFWEKQEVHIETALSKLQVFFLWCSLWI